MLHFFLGDLSAGVCFVSFFYLLLLHLLDSLLLDFFFFLGKMDMQQKENTDEFWPLFLPMKISLQFRAGNFAQIFLMSLHSLLLFQFYLHSKRTKLFSVIRDQLSLLRILCSWNHLLCTLYCLSSFTSLFWDVSMMNGSTFWSFLLYYIVRMLFYVAVYILT